MTAPVVIGVDPRCGSYAGYLAHGRRNERPCQPCRDARNAYRRALAASKPESPRVLEDIQSRFWKKVGELTAAGCREWQAAIDAQGYGRFGRGGRAGGMAMAHRVAWELARGPITDGLQIDHLCRNRACVNPDHLEPVTPKVNSQRSTCGEVNRARMLARTHCKRNHEFTPENTSIRRGGVRRCRACDREAARLYREAAKTA